jgi:hypothetical protein
MQDMRQGIPGKAEQLFMLFCRVPTDQLEHHTSESFSKHDRITERGQAQKNA